MASPVTSFLYHCYLCVTQEGKGTAGRNAGQQLRPKMSEAKLNGVLSLQRFVGLVCLRFVLRVLTRYLLAHDLASLFPAFEAHEITLNQVMTMNEGKLTEYFCFVAAQLDRDYCREFEGAEDPHQW
jgi:hypothetical protein